MWQLLPATVFTHHLAAPCICSLFTDNIDYVISITRAFHCHASWLTGQKLWWYVWTLICENSNSQNACLAFIILFLFLFFCKEGATLSGPFGDRTSNLGAASTTLQPTELTGHPNTPFFICLHYVSVSYRLHGLALFKALVLSHRTC